jgi:asparagine synthase (glutamine-hydrolysing)
VSILAGVWFFDARPAHEHAAAVHAGFELLGVPRNDRFVACAAGVVAGVGADGLWDESSRSAPVRCPSDRLLTFDGRIDNRDDVALQLHGSLAREPDATLAMAAFDRWGTEGLGRLTGEWSAVIWDGADQRLHLARDFMGTRPLYYWSGPESVMWSTSLGELALRSGRADAISEAFVARAVARDFTPELTPYQGIRAVPAATCVSFAASREVERRRIWSIGSSIVRYRRTEDYAEALRALWMDAVRVRLRTSRPVWAELSGGLDSSSIVCMASALIAAGRVPARTLDLVSHATLESPEGDERRFIAEIERRTNLRSDVFGVEAHQSLVDSEWDWVSPFACRGVGLACLRHIRQNGGRLVLSGRMGDVVMGCQPDNSAAVFDDFAGGGMFTALANVRRWSRATHEPFIGVCRNLVETLVNPVVMARRQAATEETLLTARIRLAIEPDEEPAPCGLVRPAKRPLAGLLLSYSQMARLDVPLRPSDIVYAYPFAHRPLIEFVLAIPGAVLTAPGETRSLMRAAFANLVPDRVRGRLSKGYYPPAAVRGLRSIARRPEPVDRLEVVRRGWVDPERFAAARRALVDGGREHPELRRVLRLEQWLESRQRRGPAATPIRKEVRTNGVLNA